MVKRLEDLDEKQKEKGKDLIACSLFRKDTPLPRETSLVAKINMEGVGTRAGAEIRDLLASTTREYSHGSGGCKQHDRHRTCGARKTNTAFPSRFFQLISIVVTTRNHQKLIVLITVHQTVFGIYPSGPKALKFMF